MLCSGSPGIEQWALFFGSLSDIGAGVLMLFLYREGRGVRPTEVYATRLLNRGILSIAAFPAEHKRLRKRSASPSTAGLEAGGLVGVLGFLLLSNAATA